MYAQMVKTDSSRLKTLDEMSPEERAFQERIDRGEKIEPKEWMPEGRAACPFGNRGAVARGELDHPRADAGA